MTTIAIIGVFSEWEDPQALEATGQALASAGEDFQKTLSGMQDDWRALGHHYEGEGEADLVEGFAGPVAEAEAVKAATERIDQAVWEFATRVATLRTERERCTQRIEAFNATYATVPEHELPAEAIREYYTLKDRPGELQREYEAAAEGCARDLRGLLAGGLAVDVAVDEAAVWWNSPVGQTVHGLVMGVASGVGRIQVSGNTLASKPSPLSPAWRTTLFNLDITGFLEAMTVLRGRMIATVASLNGPQMRTRLGHPVAASLLVAKLGSPHLAPAVLAQGVRPMASTAFGLLGGPSSPLRGARAAMKEASLASRLPVDVQTALVKGGKVERVDPVAPNTRLDRKQDKAFQTARGGFWQRAGSIFVDEFPLAGDIKGEIEARKPVVVDGVTAAEPKGFKVAASGLRGANVATTVLAAGLTLQDERGRERAEVQRENPSMSPDAAAAEAEKRARAQTVGNVGSSALASAGSAALAGAAAGSVVPGIGTAVGFIAGVGAGLVMSAPLLDDADGDGERDSFAERAGDAVEAVVKDPAQAVEDFGNAVADGATNAASTVAGWFGG